jgi:hypothetical protein
MCIVTKCNPAFYARAGLLNTDTTEAVKITARVASGN